MRIALVTDTFAPEINGVTTVLGVMREGLMRRGHDVLVLAPAYPGAARPAPGVARFPSVPCPGYGAVRLAAPWSPGAVRALDAFSPDVVHAVTEGPLGALGRRVARRRKIALVTSYHTDFPRYAARYLGAWAERPARAYFRRFHAPAFATQTPSEQTRGELVAMGLPRAVVWGRGVDAAHFNPARRSEARRAALGADGRLLVLHVGRLAVEKDPETLVAAFQSAHAALGDRACFCITGDGPVAERVRRALPFALHRGFLDRTRELPELYADADLFVFPSSTETCGLVALEAMASGLPVIGADRGGVLENLRDGCNGLVARAGDPVSFARAILTLADDPANRHAMAAAARAFAVARDWERELDALEPMYAAACAAARGIASGRVARERGGL